MKTPSLTIIAVTPEDIAKGKRGLKAWCPVARAIRRTTRLKSISVGPSDIFLEGLDWVGSQPTPVAVSNFIYAFDHRKRVKPFEFVLLIPPFAKHTP